MRNISTEWPVDPNILLWRDARPIKHVDDEEPASSQLDTCTPDYLCFENDRFGNSPLHIAAGKGRVEVVNELLKRWPESVEEVTAATAETCLHAAVKHNKAKVVHYLVSWIKERRQYVNLLNCRDVEGNTALHISTSRKQLQILRELLSTGLVDVNALNSGGFTALDILCVLPYSGKIDMEIDLILRQAGAMRAQDLADQNISRRIISNDVKSTFRHRSTLLLVATLLATVTYQAAFHLLGSTFRRQVNVYDYRAPGTSFQMNEHDSIASNSFVFLNSTVFLASVGVIIFLLNEFPLKPWPQISVSALFGSYMCSIMIVSPNEALPMLFVSIPFLLMAAAGKLFATDL